MNKPVIGRNIAISFGKRAVGVPAKVDTGADSSSIWASKIRIDKEGNLRFALFGEGSPFYTGKIYIRRNYKVAVVRSSSGHEQIRYRVCLTTKINEKRIRILYNLSDRSQNIFPVLIGRRSVSGKFLVDVEKADFDLSKKFTGVNRGLNEELAKDPVAFHSKYHGKKAI